MSPPLPHLHPPSPLHQTHKRPPLWFFCFHSPSMHPAPALPRQKTSPSPSLQSVGQLFPPPWPPKRSDVITVLAGRRAGGGEGQQAFGWLGWGALGSVTAENAHFGQTVCQQACQWDRSAGDTDVHHGTGNHIEWCCPRPRTHPGTWPGVRRTVSCLCPLTLYSDVTTLPVPYGDQPGPL